jgi:hypothetical protein
MEWTKSRGTSRLAGRLTEGVAKSGPDYARAELKSMSPMKLAANPA